MPIDAIEIKVRGFESEFEVNVIFNTLLRFGFKLKRSYDDLRLGNLLFGEDVIETEVMGLDRLASGVHDINEVLCLRPGIVVSKRQYAVVKDWTDQTGASESAE